MNLSLQSILPPQLRRRIALLLVLAVLSAGIAQAAHFHKDELKSGQTDVHCLLCQFAGGNATPPAPLALVRSAAPRYCSYRCFASTPCPDSCDVASYDARGPPSA